MNDVLTLAAREPEIVFTTGQLSGAHKTQLASDMIHAIVVLVVVFCVTVLASLKVGLPPDVIGTVYGGAIGYAAGRAGNVAKSPVLITGKSYAENLPYDTED